MQLMLNPFYPKITLMKHRQIFHRETSEPLEYSITIKRVSENLYKPILRKLESELLKSIEVGDRHVVSVLIEKIIDNHLNLNCIDRKGRGPIRIAIEAQHYDILELLIQCPMIHIKDSLLYAVKNEDINAVDIILQRNTSFQTKKNDPFGFSGSSFDKDITPLILAAHLDNYLIVKMLLDQGHYIEIPHDMKCSCTDCIQAGRLDGLHHSRRRINAYKALISPSLICLTSSDPILTAFELSWELQRLGKIENEFTEVYQKMSIQCEEFATNLLEQVRSSEELSIILNHDCGYSPMYNFNTFYENLRNFKIFKSFQADEPGEEDYKSEGHLMHLSRLKLAIKLDQKKFVTHPHCQQLLASLWYEGVPGFRRRPLITKITMVLFFCFLYPLISLIYILSPNSRYSVTMRKPLIKFIFYNSSYTTFLVLLTLVSLKIEFQENLSNRISQIGPGPSIIESILIVFICGYFWQNVEKVWKYGFKIYSFNRWNILDLVTNIMFIATIMIRIFAWLRVYYFSSNITKESRENWSQFEPVLVSEAIFAFAHILATVKLSYVFTLNAELGPLQISLTKMINDVFKFFCVYMLVLAAFAFGLNQLQWFYSNENQELCKDVKFDIGQFENETALDLYQYCTTTGQYFANLFEIVQTLYWSTYGLIELQSLNLQYKHLFTEFFTKLIYGAYSWIGLIVLVNMFIAMMNDSYQKIARSSDIEWKFARSKLWISYFNDDNVIPVPFNLLPSPNFFLNLLRELYHCGKNSRFQKIHSSKQHFRKIYEKESRYENVMDELVRRYLIQRQRRDKNRTINEEDVDNIKSEFEAFRRDILTALNRNKTKSAPDSKTIKPNMSRKTRRSSVVENHTRNIELLKIENLARKFRKNISSELSDSSASLSSNFSSNYQEVRRIKRRKAWSVVQKKMRLSELLKK